MPSALLLPCFSMLFTHLSSPPLLFPQGFLRLPQLRRLIAFDHFLRPAR
jgi:hypothetical protein